MAITFLTRHSRPIVPEFVNENTKLSINPLLLGRHKIEALYLYLGTTTSIAEFLDYKKKLQTELTMLNSNISLHLLTHVKNSEIKMDIEVVTNLFKQHNSMVRVIRSTLDNVANTLDIDPRAAAVLNHKNSPSVTDSSLIKSLDAVRNDIAHLVRIWRALERFERRVFSF
jgi:hypothetical protein